MDTLQAQTLRTLMRTEEWERYSGVIEIDMLSGSESRALYEAIRSLHSDREANISFGELTVYFESRYGEGQKLDSLLEAVNYVKSAEDLEEQALDQAIRKFASRQLSAQAAKYIATNMGSGSLDPAVALALCQRAVDITESVASEVMDIHEADLPGESDDRPNLCSMGISSKLDACIGGGIAAGELAVYLAPPSRGKTSYLCKTGAEAALAGKHVLHITLEISRRRALRRYDCAITGRRLVDLKENPHLVANARKRMADAGGKVYIKDWSYADVTPNKVKGLVKGMRAQGKRIDMVVIDYLELMQPDKEGWSRDEHRHMLGRLGKQTRSMSVSLDCPVITAWQGNRASTSKHTIDESDVSESWDIIKHADLIIGLNQNQEELREHRLRVNIIKQRESTDRKTFILWSDLNRMAIMDAKDAAHEDMEVAVIGGEDDGSEAVESRHRPRLYRNGSSADLRGRSDDGRSSSGVDHADVSSG